eukprot:jgi/Chlat1/5694/Chrsp38S05521
MGAACSGGPGRGHGAAGRRPGGGAGQEQGGGADGIDHSMDGVSGLPWALARQLSPARLLLPPPLSPPPRKSAFRAVAPCGGGVPTLLDLCVAVAAEAACGPDPVDLSRLPGDLSQCVLDRMLACGEGRRLLKLPMLAAAFDGCPLTQLSWARLPHLDDSWLRWLAAQDNACASVVSVDLAGCRGLGDGGVAALSRLSRCEKLSLAGCARITDAGVAKALSSSLTSLSLAGCSQLTGYAITAIAAICGQSLVRLDLEMCPVIAGGLAALKTLPRLRTLLLGWCTGVSDDDLADCLPSNLRELGLSRTSITDATCTLLASRLSHSLRRLTLAGCSITDAGMCMVAKCMRLKTLSVEWCSGVGDAGFEEVAKGCTNLRSLHLGYTHVTDGGLLAATGGRRLQQLQHLSLDSCGAVTDKGLAALRLLPSLQELDLSDTNITDKGASRHLAALGPGLRVLQLGCCGVGDAALQAMGVGLTGLEKLGLDSRNVTDTGVLALASLGSTLLELDLFAARVTDAGVGHIAGSMKRLRALELCGGALTDRAACSLVAVQSLRTLNLAQNHRMSDTALRYLGKLLHLHHLNLSHTRVTLKGVSANLKHLHELESLTLSGTGIKSADLRRALQDHPNIQTVTADG